MADHLNKGFYGEQELVLLRSPGLFCGMSSAGLDTANRNAPGF